MYFVSNILTLETGKLWSEERVPQRWGSTLLSQLLFPPWDSLLPSPDSLPGRLRRADCTNANNLAESVHWNGMKNQFYIRGLHQKNYKRKYNSLTHSFSFSSFFLSITTPDPDYPYSRTISGSKDRWSSCFSFSFPPLFLSSLALSCQSAAIIFYPVLCTQVCCRSWDLVEVVKAVKVKDLIENTFDTKEWASYQS